MSKTAERFASNKSAGQGLLVGYFPVGFPTLSESIEAAIAMCKNGVDVLELGIPYSDPVMDGPVIQDATELAIKNGFRLRQVFDAVRAVTEAVTTPILVMTYWNPVVQFGVGDFAKKLHEAGGAGLITPDLIPDEAADWIAASDLYNLDRVFFATPTSSSARTKAAAELSRGFIYCVSTMGITGTRDEVDDLAKKVVAGVRATGVAQNAAVGIGISNAEQVSDVNSYADGAIVGSAFVKAYQTGGINALVAKVRELDPKSKK